jgi:hypothetical protein
MCRKFYQIESKARFWNEELAMLDEGISWARGEISKHPAPRYQLVGFDLVKP